MRSRTVPAVLSLLCLACAESPSSPESRDTPLAAAPTGPSTIQELSAPPGNSGARDVNASGVIAGSRTGGCWRQPVVWSAQGVSNDLPLLPSECGGLASVINSQGMVMGPMTGSTGSATTLVRWIPDGSGYTVESMELLPDGAVADVKDLNDAGFAVANRNGGPVGSRPFWWSEATGFVPLAMAPGATECYAHAINELAEIAGSCNVNGSIAAYWSSPSATPILLPKLPGYNGLHQALGLNDSGIAVGTAWNSKGGRITSIAVRWVRAGETWTVCSLGGLGGKDGAANDVNAAGWITGWSELSSGKDRAFLWVPGQGMRDLGTLGPESWGYAINSPVPGTPLLIAGATGVSDVSGVRRAVVWRP
jgi:probable HAF family extracellular repeat protein